ncbi:hypothetical protein [Corynebacterium sp. HMSC072A04]|uniref:hypothetical protein n=1 Tax=Corynebacterium sp. HMSC072A04 TaxID=1715045 RepID=UPI0008BCDFA7|nr:hypothetical protein [Corynebacterium sp. HMSC072A04]OFN33632.1 hypothetical protein HMPREF2565_11890 [Corynebacterium sp. HMSC072A04]
MTTLADMTPTERAECVGMWGNHIFWGQVLISITDGVQFRGVNVEVIRFIDGRPVREWASTSEVTPRPDLPRAWAPDGTPPAGEWEYVPEIWNPWLDDWRPIDDATTNEIAAEAWMGMEQFNDEGGRVRKRWVGSWEEA